MATAQELADTALQLAHDFLAAHRGQLAALAAGERDTLLQATRLVRAGAHGGSASGRADEHIAFTLLSAAFAEATAQHRRPA